MQDPYPTDRTIGRRLLRLLAPSTGARANAAEALRSLERTSETTGLAGSDVGLLSGHPAGHSPRRVAARLEAGVWEEFPAEVALLDRHGVVVSVNAAWRRFGRDHGGGEACGLGVDYLAICDDAAAANEPEAAEAAALVRAALAGDATDRRLNYACGPGRWFSLQAIPIPGRDSGVLVVHTDITVRRQAEQWRHLALHDELTGLPNRALLEDRLAHALRSAPRSGPMLAVILLGLDGFEQVNDAHGHAAGDLVLQVAAQRMAESLRAGDTLGRWGGGEFLVVAERIASPRDAHELAARIRSSLSAPVDVGGRRVPVPVSTGVALFDADQTAEALIDSADRAMQAKRRSRRN